MLGIKNAQFHDLRRTFGLNLSKQGMSIYKISKLLRHKSVKTTEQHYASILTVENQKRGSTLCRDDNYRPIILMEELPLGEFYDVEIIDSEYGFMTAILA